jgi:hypothetical protein
VHELNKAKHMSTKMAVLIVLVIIASLSVAGCSDNKKQNSPNTGNNAAVALTVNSVTTYNKLSKYPFETTPTPGHNYVVVDLTLTNLNKNDLYMGNALNFKLSTSDGTAYSYSSWTYLLNNAIGSGVFHTNPGEKVTGQIAFEIPQSTHATQLTYGDGFNPSVTTNL